MTYSGCRSYAKGFGAMGALFAGSECVIEKTRARHDAYNSVYAGTLIQVEDSTQECFLVTIAHLLENHTSDKCICKSSQEEPFPNIYPYESRQIFLLVI